MEHGPTRDDILTWKKIKGKEVGISLVVKSSNGSYIWDVM